MNSEDNKDIQNNFRTKVKEYVNQNGVEILQSMFPETSQIEQTEEKESKPNNKKYLDLDSPIKKRIKTNEYLIEIYNWPAFFRVDYGLITLFNECKVIFKIFFEKNKQYKEEEQKERFFSFFKSIIYEEHEIIKKFTEINYDTDKIYSIKRGIEKLIDYFDLKSVENYFFVNSKNDYQNKFGMLGGGVLGLASLIALVVSGTVLWGIGLVVCIGLVIYFNRRNSSQEKKDDEVNKLNKMTNKIEKFFDNLNFFENKDSSLTMNINNIFIIAIDKTKGNYGDSVVFHHSLKGLDSKRFPKDFNGNDSINMKYYKAYLKAFDYYSKKFKKYEEKYKSVVYKEQINLISKKILEDFKKLKDAENDVQIYDLIKEETKKDKEEEEKEKEKERMIEKSGKLFFPSPNKEVLDSNSNISVSTNIKASSTDPIK